MPNTFRQPIKKRIQDITAFGVLFLVMSILPGNFNILMFTIPAFLILASILATGRYRRSRFCAYRNYAYLEEKRKSRVFLNCKNLYTRRQIHGH